MSGCTPGSLPLVCFCKAGVPGHQSTLLEGSQYDRVTREQDAQVSTGLRDAKWCKSKGQTTPLMRWVCSTVTWCAPLDHASLHCCPATLTDVTTHTPVRRMAHGPAEPLLRPLRLEPTDEVRPLKGCWIKLLAFDAPQVESSAYAPRSLQGGTHTPGRVQ